MVDYGILIDVCDTPFNIGGKPLHWFKSYLYPSICNVNIVEVLPVIKIYVSQSPREAYVA